MPRPKVEVTHPFLPEIDEDGCGVGEPFRLAKSAFKYLWKNEEVEEEKNYFRFNGQIYASRRFLSLSKEHKASTTGKELAEQTGVVVIRAVFIITIWRGFLVYTL